MNLTNEEETRIDEAVADAMKSLDAMTDYRLKSILKDLGCCSKEALSFARKAFYGS